MALFFEAFIDILSLLWYILICITPPLSPWGNIFNSLAGSISRACDGHCKFVKIIASVIKRKLLALQILKHVIHQISTYHMRTSRSDQLSGVLRHQPIQGPLSQHVCREPSPFPGSGTAGRGHLSGEVHPNPSALLNPLQVYHTLYWSHTTQSAPHCLCRTVNVDNSKSKYSRKTALVNCIFQRPDYIFKAGCLRWFHRQIFDLTVIFWLTLHFTQNFSSVLMNKCFHNIYILEIEKLISRYHNFKAYLHTLSLNMRWRRNTRKNSVGILSMTWQFCR